jgi:hypothetical protein
MHQDVQDSVNKKNLKLKQGRDRPIAQTQYGRRVGKISVRDDDST